MSRLRARSAVAPAVASIVAMTLGLALATTGAPPASAAISDVYYERALMVAADTRCGLFTPDIASALAAATFQARGGALRAGIETEALAAIADQARARAAATACKAPQLLTVAARVRDAFKGYGRLLRMDFPGDTASWKADRSLPRYVPVWRLSQTSSLSGKAGSDAVTFGLAGMWGAPQKLVAVADFGDEESPYAARLVVRDAVRAPQPYLKLLRTSSAASLPLRARTPPPSATLVFAAEARGPADPTLNPAGVRSAMAFRFPAAAAEAIAVLDPREAMTIEFLYAGRRGDVIRKAYIEVGDFAAGRAFLAASKR